MGWGGSRSEEQAWSEIKPQVISVIMDFYSSGDALFRSDPPTPAVLGAPAASPDGQEDEVCNPPHHFLTHTPPPVHQHDQNMRARERN